MLTLKQLKSLIADIEAELEEQGFTDEVEVKIDSLAEIQDANIGFHDTELYEPFVFIGLNVEDSKTKRLFCEHVGSILKREFN